MLKADIPLQRQRKEKTSSLFWRINKITNFLINKKMDKLFLANDVLTSEMDELLGGVKVKVKVTRPDGTTYEVELEW